LRIGIAASVWWSLELMQASWPANAPGAPLSPGVYHPLGIWMLFGDQPPSHAVIEALWLIARVSTLAMLIGAFSRAATAVSFAATVALASLSYTGMLSWSHQYNPVLLAQLAFLGARGGDAFSVDAIARRFRGQPDCNVYRGYQWSIRLVQLAVALVFAGALYHKLRSAGFTLRWATTDNLRHHLLLRYDLGDVPHPRIVAWILEDVWRYRGAAALSMISQGMPLAACLLVRRPVLRAMCGAFFMMEVLGIGAIMQLWNPNWLLLGVVFVDWDALLRAHAVPAPASTSTSWRVPRGPSVFIGAFVALELATAFVPRLDSQLRAYPFTSFQMFATLRVREPYDQHLPYGLSAGHFEIDPPSDEASNWLDHAYRTTIRNDPRELPARLDGILDDARARYPGRTIRGIRLELVILETRAYPAPARLEPHLVGIVGELRDGAFATELGKEHHQPLVYFRSDRSDAYAVPMPGASIGVALIDDRPWVVHMPAR
jgi:hypothetical protein